MTYSNAKETRKVPKVQDIVDSIRAIAYLRDQERFENRLDSLEHKFDDYFVPDFSESYPIFRVWPLKPIIFFAMRVVRKIFFTMSRLKGESFHELVFEVRSLHRSVRELERRVPPQPQDNYRNE